MGHSRVEVYIHLVWATQGRQPLIDADLEGHLYRLIMSEAKRLQCDVLALGGMADHIHLVITLPTALSIAKLVQQVKGVSSKMANERTEGFRWQEGYSVFSLSRPHLAKVVPYVQNQKQHHANGSLWDNWEQMEDATP